MKVELEDALIILAGAALGGVLYMWLQPVLFTPITRAITA